MLILAVLILGIFILKKVFAMRQNRQHCGGSCAHPGKYVVDDGGGGAGVRSGEAWDEASVASHVKLGAERLVRK